jgi:hypothetical protein
MVESIIIETLFNPNVRFWGVIVFWILWGIGENRLWNCNNNKGIIWGHFSAYHIMLATFCVILAGIGATNLLQFTFLVIYSFFGLDVVWWVVRYFHFKIKGQEIAGHYYNEPNAWHEVNDWDNFLGLPLIGIDKYKVYWWWILCLILLVIIGLVM